MWYIACSPLPPRPVPLHCAPLLQSTFFRVQPSRLMATHGQSADAFTVSLLPGITVLFQRGVVHHFICN